MSSATLLRAGGLCSILVTLSLIVGLVLVGLSGVVEFGGNADTWLLSVGENRPGFVSGAWFFPAASLLSMVVAISLYQVLRDAGAVLWIGLAAWFVGLLFIIAADLTEISMAYELAPSYVDAGIDTKPALAIMASTLELRNDLARLIGNWLFLGIGLGMFSVATLRASILPTQLGWLGVAAALLGGWLALFGPLSSAIGAVVLVGYICFMAWMLLMGIALLWPSNPLLPMAEVDTVAESGLPLP